jgi:hypothetical protein
MGRFQNNPSIGWVHPKSTHPSPLVWGNNNWKKIEKKISVDLTKFYSLVFFFGKIHQIFFFVFTQNMSLSYNS